MASSNGNHKPQNDSSRPLPAERYHAMVEALDGLIYICSPDYRIEYMNRQFIERCGQDGSGKICYEVIHHRTDRCPWCVNDRIAAGETVRWEVQSPLDNRWYYVVNTPLRNPDGTISKFSMMTDITERKDMEERLRRSEEKFSKAFNTSPDAIILVRACDGVLLEVNDGFVSLSGFTRGEAVGRAVTSVPGGLNLYANAADRDRLLEGLRERGEVSAFEAEFRTKDGSTGQGLLYSRLIEINGERCIISLIRDIREQRRQEESLRNAQKLESLGVLAGGIAHDFNNLLAGIFGYMDIARLQLPPGDPRTSLDEAFSVFGRARALTQQLLIFAKGGVPVKTTVSLATVISESVPFALSGSNIRASFDIQEDLWLCEADHYQISQVIDNVVINARQAMPLGGTVYITARNVGEKDPLPESLRGGKFVLIEVRDTGSGITPEVLPKVLDPFFTTKASGSGLGLTTAFSIVKKHGGSLFVESQQRQGTKVSIFLPAAFSPADAIPPARSKAAISPCRILLMDDEPALRAIGSLLLKEMGHSVTVTDNGQDAVTLFRKEQSSGKPFDLVILDLTVPGGIGGGEVLRQLRIGNPGIRAIATSGYSDDPVMADPRTFGFSSRLPKPYLKSDLLHCIDEALRTDTP